MSFHLTNLNFKKSVYLYLVILVTLFVLYSIRTINIFGNQTNFFKLNEIRFQTIEEINFEDVPPETLDKNSQFFGLIYKDTYGLPSKYDRENQQNFYEEFSKGLPFWQEFMPKTVNSLSQYRLLNPFGRKNLFTSATASSILMTPNKQYKVGNVFTAQIQARDFLNQNKIFGGDYYRATLMKVPSHVSALDDGVPCFVEDHFNGTYTIRAPLPIAGTFKLEVVLCASVEAIDAYVKWSDGRKSQGFVFEATLLSNESVACNSDLLHYEKYKSKEVCNYSNPRNQEPYFCSKPPSGICFPIKFISPFSTSKSVQTSPYNEKPFDIIAQLETKFHSYKLVTGSNSLIQVFPHEEQKGETNRGALGSNGYCSNSLWVSFTHDYEHKEIKDFVKCFADKTVYIMGDSTMRQFFDLITRPLGLEVNVIDNSKYYHVPRLGRNKQHNISIYYRAHGPPIRNPGPPSIAPYISDTISRINNGGPSVALFINIGLHYVEYNPAIFIHRLKGIKRALIEFSAKYPGTKIIIKGMNVSNLKLLPFEWLIYRQNVILKEFFKDVENCLFIDLWDMTTLWPLTVDYHPNKNILTEQANIMFSKLCELN